MPTSSHSKIFEPKIGLAAMKTKKKPTVVKMCRVIVDDFKAKLEINFWPLKVVYSMYYVIFDHLKILKRSILLI